MKPTADVAGPSPYWRAAWFLLAAGLAILAFSLQFDRASQKHPGLARNVPAFLRAVAAPPLIEQALQYGDTGRALSIAEGLVARRPYPAESLSILALAAAQARKFRLAGGAIGLSGTRGWHEQVAQAALLRDAVASGNWSGAARHAYALWAIGYEDGLPPAIDSVVKEPAGRAELLRLMAGTPQTPRNRFLDWSAGKLEPRVAAALIAGVVASGKPYECASLRGAIRRLLWRGAGEAAQAAWTGRCVTQTGPGSGRFALVPGGDDAAAGPFGWLAGATARLVPDGKAQAGWRLEYDNDEQGAKTIASRLATLGPGSYRLRVDSHRVDATSQLSMWLALVCVGPDARNRLTQRIAIGSGPVRFSVPDKDCQVQQLAIQAPGGTGYIAGTWLTGT